MGEEEASNVVELIASARALFEKSFPEADTKKVHCSVAPGRVNLIGEHVDYTGGFVLPLAISYSTVCYGIGTLVDSSDSGRCRVISTSFPSVVVEFVSKSTMTKVEEDEQQSSWINYVVGVVAQYMPDIIPKNKVFTMDLAIAGDVPLGSGLSSSASLEVAVATFLESIIMSHNNNDADDLSDDELKSRAIQRALRCQKAENDFADSPCGIMDQFVSSAAKTGMLLLIDCRSVDYTPALMGGTDDNRPVILVTNSNVTHSIAGGEYPVRVKQCREATDALVLLQKNIESLRDATLDDVESIREKVENVIYRRAKHVVTENARTVDCAKALAMGDWDKVGMLMNGSHASMRDDYEVSCEEIDFLTNIAQSYEGVYGSRLTGGGFGGCTVTLVRKENVNDLMEHLKAQYKEHMNRDCTCFVTGPANGAHIVLTP